MSYEIEKGQTSDLSITEASVQLVGRKKLDHCTNSIKCSLGDVRQGFFDIGEELCKVRDEGLYRFAGYDSVADFSEKNFGFKSTMTKNLISVYEVFKDEDGELCEDFDDVPSSRLIELLPLKDDKELCKGLKDLSVKSIKAAKEAVKNVHSSDSLMSGIVRKCVPFILQAFDKAGLVVSGSRVENPNYNPDYSDSHCEFRFLVFGDQFKEGLKFYFNENENGAFVETHRYEDIWIEGFCYKNFYLTDDFNTSLLEPFAKGLIDFKKALSKKALEATKLENLKSFSKKESSKPFVPPTKEQITSYLADSFNWQGSYVYLFGFSVDALLHCPFVYRFEYQSKGSDDVVYLYIDLYPDKVKKDEVSCFKDLDAFCCGLDSSRFVK